MDYMTFADLFQYTLVMLGVMSLTYAMAGHKKK